MALKKRLNQFLLTIGALTVLSGLALAAGILYIMWDTRTQTGNQEQLTHHDDSAATDAEVADEMTAVDATPGQSADS